MSNVRKADQHAANVLPVIRQIAAQSASLRQIADELNTGGIKTARGGLWYAATVRNVMARQGEIEALVYPNGRCGLKATHRAEARTDGIA